MYIKATAKLPIVTAVFSWIGLRLQQQRGKFLVF